MLIPFQGQKISKIPSPAYLLLSRPKSGSGRRSAPKGSGQVGFEGVSGPDPKLKIKPA